MAILPPCSAGPGHILVEKLETISAGSAYLRSLEFSVVHDIVYGNEGLTDAGTSNVVGVHGMIHLLQASDACCK